MQMKKLLLLLLLLIAVLMVLLAAFPERATDLAFRAERAASGLEYKALSVEGEIWHYLEGGPDDAEVVLLLHGFGGEKDNWTRFLKHLTGRYKVIAPDLPGFGESARHADWDYSVIPQRDRVQGFAQALGLERYHLAGHSMGGHISITYAYEYPAQVASLALFNNGGIHAPNESELMRRVKLGESPLVIRSDEGFKSMMALVFNEQPFAPWPMKKVLAQRAMANADFNQTIFESLMQDFETDLAPVLAAIGSPVFILWGDSDKILDVSSVRVMQQALPDADVVIMADMGHVPMLERPAETAEHYRTFLQQLAR
jgi:pimeloyl-ACP methyl ester carboxylesterase